jgi:hypothetical protein
MSDTVLVTGGAAGVEAQWAEALGLADAVDDTGDRVRTLARQGATLAVDPDLIASGLLAPTSAAMCAAALLEAAGGVLVGALSLEADAVGIRAAVSALRAADEAVTFGFDVLDYAVVRAATTSLLTSPGTAAVGLAALGLEGESLATEHPGLVEHAVNGGGGLLDALRAPFLPAVTTATTAAGAAALASAYWSPTRPVVSAYPGSVGTGSPTSVHALLARLHEVALLSPTPHAAGNGTIAVQTLGPPGQRRHVVYLPGTDRFEAPPGGGPDVREMRTNLELAAGLPDDYTAGIREAMHRAGVRPGEPVLLVGHSQGGMAAVSLAASPGEFAITDVVTAGAPTAQVGHYPAGVHVLSLEQQGDVVPLLDGRPNPPSVEQTTARFDASPPEGVVGHHDYPAYLDGAALVDASDDPSVTDAIGSLRAHGFLSDAPSSTQLFQVTREPVS